MQKTNTLQERKKERKKERKGKSALVKQIYKTK